MRASERCLSRRRKMNQENIKEEDKAFILNTYKRYNVVIKEGRGSTLYDYNGKKYIDFSSGIGTNSFGVQDPKWIEAVCAQAHQLQHISNLYYTEPQVKVAQLLCEKTGMRKVFFSNSGAESNECAIKTARKYSFDKYGKERYDIITLEGSFHGRTIATLSATGQDHFHQSFFPFVGGFRYAKPNDLETLKSMIDEHTCAIMIETIQGEGGVFSLDKAFIQGIEKLCLEHDLVFIVDEVQTGNGRTGYLYSYMEYGVHPDIVTTAKGLAGGLPFGAILMSEKVEYTLGYGEHGTTFGGNPICANAAYSVLSRMDDTLFEHVKECRKMIEDALLPLPIVKQMTGKGLMIGIELDTQTPVSEYVAKGIEKGVILLTAKTRLRLLPALNISFEELKEGLEIIKEVLCL